MKTPKDKIKLVIDRLGMSGSIAAKAMGISNSNYNKKIMPSSTDKNTFTDQNYNDLVSFIIAEISFIKSHIEEDNMVIDFQSVVDKVNDLYNNFESYSKVEDWNLFDELKTIINSMETIHTFSNNELYTKIINIMEDKFDENKFENHQFTIAKYNDYALSDSKGNHSGWFNFMDERRKKTIMDILRD